MDDFLNKLIKIICILVLTIFLVLIIFSFVSGLRNELMVFP